MWNWLHVRLQGNYCMHGYTINIEKHSCTISDPLCFWLLCYSVRLWKVPVATLMESDDGSDNSSQVNAFQAFCSFPCMNLVPDCLTNWVLLFSAIGCSCLEECILVCYLASLYLQDDQLKDIMISLFVFL